jgi:tryptophan halogenase
MNVVVIGGGTAGCISALLFKKKFPDIDITVIRSKEIGVLGPGEGLTPAINSFLKDLDISIEDFIENTGATIKHGVMFNNWDLENSSWFHGFYDFYKDKNHTIDNNVLNLYKVAVNLKTNLNDINYLYHLVKNKKIDISDPINYGFHIDAKKLVLFLEDIALKNNIKIIDAKVLDIEKDNKENISKIILLDNSTIDCDFVVDCSGFNKIIIKKHYNAEWQSMSHLLPATNSLTAFLPSDDKYYPYTDATAMKYGWSWKIPLQHRYGCGYVYDGNYITEQEAKDELIKLYGNEIQFIGNFSYDPGFLKQPWIKNCFSNGLSSSFFEPIEATSISTAISQMYYFLIYFFPKYIKNIDNNIQDLYNKNFVLSQISLASFLHFHYKTNKIDTEFWKLFNGKYTSPKKINDFENIMNTNTIDKNIFDVLDYEILKWPNYSWMSLYAGNKMHKNCIELDITEIEEYNKSVKAIKQLSSNNGIDHIEFLQKIKNKGE